MSNIALNVKISLTEFGVSGFLLKDLTGIAQDSLRPANTEQSPTYLRTKDIVIVDFVTYKKIGGSKMTSFTSACKSDEDYLSYKLEYNAAVDGWYVIDHILLPTYTWAFNAVTSNPDPYKGKILYAVTFSGENMTYTKITVSAQGSATSTTVPITEIYSNLDNENLLGIEKEVFLIGNLEKCYNDHIKYIYYNQLYARCHRGGDNTDKVIKDKNLLFIALELVRILIRQCNFYEAERILEGLNNQCGGFCKDLKYSNKTIMGCNCT